MTWSCFASFGTTWVSLIRLISLLTMDWDLICRFGRKAVYTSSSKAAL